MRPARRRFAGNPFLVFGGRPIREERLRSYIVAQHRVGRELAEILEDRRVQRLGGASLTWRTLVSPATIDALRRDASDDIRGSIAALAASIGHGSGSESRATR